MEKELKKWIVERYVKTIVKRYTTVKWRKRSLLPFFDLFRVGDLQFFRVI